MFDGLYPITWTTPDLTTTLVYGPAGPAHQTTTTTTGRTGDDSGKDKGKGCSNGGTTLSCPSNGTTGTGNNEESGEASVPVTSWLYLDRQHTTLATAGVPYPQASLFCGLLVDLRNSGASAPSSHYRRSADLVRGQERRCQRWMF